MRTLTFVLLILLAACGRQNDAFYYRGYCVLNTDGTSQCFNADGTPIP